MSAEAAREELARRVDAIEGGYEMMLAYAAQGVPSDQGASSGAQLRAHLQRFDEALTGLVDALRQLAEATGAQPAASVEAFLQVIGRDAECTQSALRLVMAKPGISSQLIDNVNASIHVRALLTDIFLIDEVLK